MALNFIEKGERIEVTAAAALSSGDLFFVGDLAAVAAVDIALGAVGNAHVGGVFQLAKPTGIIFAQGDPVYYDASAGKCTSVTGDGANRFVGLAWAAAATLATVVNVALNKRAFNSMPFSIPVPLGAVTMEDGTYLTKQATTVAGLAQLADKERVIYIPVDCTSGESLGFDVALPKTLNTGQPVTINVLVGKDADNDALTLDCEAYLVAAGDLANADAQSADAQAIVAAGTWLQFTIPAASLLSGAQALSAVLALGGINDGDKTYIYAIRVDGQMFSPAAMN